MTSDEYPHGREVQFDFLCLYARETEKFHDIIKAAYFQSPIHTDIARIVDENYQKHPLKSRLRKSILRELVRGYLGKKRREVWPTYKAVVDKIFAVHLDNRANIIELACNFAKEQEYRAGLIRAEQDIHSGNFDAAHERLDKLREMFLPMLAEGGGPKLPAYHLHEFLAQADTDDPAGDYLVFPIVPKKGAVLVYGLPKEVKSWLGVELAIDVASGRKAFGYFDVPRPAKTLYVQVEDSEALTRERIRLVAQERGLGRLVGQLKVVPRCGLNLMDKAWVLLLEQEIKKFKPELVVLDVFRRLFRGNVNEAEQTAGFFRVLDNLRDEYGCSIVLVHHARKNNESAAIQTMALGSVNITAWPEVLVYTSAKRKMGNATVADLQLEGKDLFPDGLEIVVDSESDPVVRIQPKAGSENYSNTNTNREDARHPADRATKEIRYYREAAAENP